jgi:hypothetical protein
VFMFNNFLGRSLLVFPVWHAPKFCRFLMNQIFVSLSHFFSFSELFGDASTPICLCSHSLDFWVGGLKEM